MSIVQILVAINRVAFVATTALWAALCERDDNWHYGLPKKGYYRRPFAVTIVGTIVGGLWLLLSLLSAATGGFWPLISITLVLVAVAPIGAAFALAIISKRISKRIDKVKSVDYLNSALCACFVCVVESIANGFLGEPIWPGLPALVAAVVVLVLCLGFIIAREVIRARDKKRPNREIWPVIIEGDKKHGKSNNPILIWFTLAGIIMVASFIAVLALKAIFHLS